MPKSESIPQCPKMPSSESRYLELTYPLEVVTPLVGGGASSGTIDLDFPVRVTTIRGHLRHYWRLLNAKHLGDSQWQREEEVFGSVEFPSPISLRVEKVSKPLQFDPSDKQLIDQFGPVAYALFSSIENDHMVTREGLTFELKVRIASEELLAVFREKQNSARKKQQKPPLPNRITNITKDVQDALSVWCMLGGLGGRTRRGCGAVVMRNTDSAVISAVPGRLYLAAPKRTAADAWETCLEVYKDFRQSPRGKLHAKTIQTRNGAKSIRVPGRSHWPEADSIRYVTGCALRPRSGASPSDCPVDEDTHDHSTPVVPKNLLPSFPKVLLGLPINFHFADGPGKNRGTPNLDPKDVQIYPILNDKRVERMASPVITRPILLDNKWHPMIYIIDQTLPAQLEFVVIGRSASATGNDIEERIGMNSVIGSNLAELRTMRGKPSVIEALIDFISSTSIGFREIAQ